MRNYTPRKNIGLVLCCLLALAAALLTSACGRKADNSTIENSGDQTGGLKPALNSANEAAALRSLLTIYSAENQYMLSHAENYATFEQLAADRYLDGRFASAAPVVDGYAFTIRLTPKAGSESAAYSINADPKPINGTSLNGARYLYIDSTSNVIHTNPAQPATASDPPLQ